MLFNEEHPECNQQLRLLFEHLLLLPVRQTLQVHLWNNHKNYCMLIILQIICKTWRIDWYKADLLRDLTMKPYQSYKKNYVQFAEAEIRLQFSESRQKT